MDTEPKDNKKEDASADVSFEEEASEAPSDVDELSRAERQSVRQKNELKTCLMEKQEYLDGWQRARAELQNAKKHFASEQKVLTQFAELTLVEDLLRVLDSFDMAFLNRSAWEKVDETWRKGVEYIHRELLSVLENRGLKPFEPLGEVFNPTEHESVGVVEVAESEKEGTVVAVLQHGYRLGGRVIRPAKVSIAHYNKSKH